jgi:hypothetical protein
MPNIMGVDYCEMLTYEPISMMQFKNNGYTRNKIPE